MSKQDDHLAAADARRAAALIVHYGRGDVDGLNAVFEESRQAGRGVALIVSLLGLYEQLIPELRTELAQSFLSHHLMRLAGVEAGESEQ